MRRTFAAAAFALAVLWSFGLALPQQSSQPASKPDKTKILGTWNLEINAGEMIVNLTMIVEEIDGKLAGKVSEQNGMFTDAALAKIELSGEDFAAEISVPSPPDNAVKTWALRFKLGDETLTGTIANADLGMTAEITGKRVKK